MGAKIMLTGNPQNIQFNEKKNTVFFTIITGPAVNHPPKGLKLFKPTIYLVQCSKRQWNRGRFNDEDESDLIIEGYQEPRQINGKLMIAVGAMAVQSVRTQKERKLKQLATELEKTQIAFKEANVKKPSPPNLQELAARFLKARESFNKFRKNNPELTG